MPIGQAGLRHQPRIREAPLGRHQGIVRDNPCYAICRSQQDVEIVGHWKRLIPGPAIRTG